MADNGPAAILKDIEEFTRALGNQASQDVLEMHLKDLTPDDIKLRYLFACQMMASFLEPAVRKDMHIGMIKMMAAHDGVDLDDE